MVYQFLHSLCKDHWNVVIRILKHIKGSSRKGLDMCVSIGGNLMSWKNKKQSVMAISSAQTEYIVWLLYDCICSECVACIMQNTQYLFILLNRINYNKDTII